MRRPKGEGRRSGTARQAVLLLVLVGLLGCERRKPDAEIEPTDTEAVLPDTADVAFPGEKEGPCEAERPDAGPEFQVVAVYFSCPERLTGNMYPAYRVAPDSVSAVEAAVEALMAGPTEAERSAGFQSFFSEETAGSLREARWSAGRDTVTFDFRDFRSAMPEGPAVRSFVPPGVPAELTWTIFKAEPSPEAVRFSFDGSEAEFWKWLGSDHPEVFTRRDWEQV